MASSADDAQSSGELGDNGSLEDFTTAGQGQHADSDDVNGAAPGEAASEVAANTMTNEPAAAQSKTTPAEDDVEEVKARSALPPSVESEDPNERIRARRLRIAARREAERRAAAGIEDEPEEEESQINPEPVKSNIRITQGHQALDQLREQGSDRVTLVRVTADFAESKRRRELAAARTERRQRLQEERDVTVTMYERIKKLMSESVVNKSVPELHETLQNQHAACRALIDRKDQLISEFSGQLKAKDDEYVRLLRAQTADVDSMLTYLDEEIQTLAANYHQQLEEIEEAFMAERQELLDATRQEWQSTVDARRDRELAYLQRATERVEEQERQLEHLRVTDLEEYSIIKGKLEQDIMQLQQQLQAMKATYQLNTEKLEYNYAVLKKREEENAITISQQKRQLNKLTDVLNSLQTKIAKQEHVIEQDNVKLTSEYTRAVQHFEDLQKKVRQFTAADRHRIDEVWDMNEEALSELAKQLLAADQAIHEQQLGVQWVRPLEVVFDSTASEQQVRSRAASAIARELLEGHEVDDLASGHLSTDTMRRALALLCEEGDFLLEPNFDDLLQDLEPTHRNLLRLDAMFKALNVHTEEDMKQLATYFIASDQDQAAGDEEESDGHSKTQQDRLRLIPAVEVVPALRAFVEARHAAKGAAGTLGPSTATLSRNEKFWERLADIVPPEHERNYGALRDALERYHQMLTDRAQGIDDVDHLKQQNGELRMLLKQYMTSDANKSLVVPPTAVLAHQLQQGQQAATAAAANAK
ncbi:uncharacterized protein MONBRDRAFT_32581 [Monosiga brevicollis MX1]|uniref:Dynein regulatory complex protein 1 n=1 Tax=Monosiga brevicollis TaxID=81824 RepID=A9V0G8_MONBE|nr:uncharacterized protein MONBRDRAFT_32581 [Monosiga brevicollis MX1]EDQ89153.1 predicted protein [Monosiga brevicollis MX1]|eukprot:XP_001746258.1 hypothetical protein [Monosiga brevicollis MX1]